jgi:hypothetical protein
MENLEEIKILIFPNGCMINNDMLPLHDEMMALLRKLAHLKPVLEQGPYGMDQGVLPNEHHR